MNYVREKDIKKILELSEVRVETVFDKCTNVIVKLPNGFVLSASSGAVDIENYNERLGVECCMKKIEDELWKLEGYALAKKLHKENAKNKYFRDVYLDCMEGKKIKRKHWNGYWFWENGSFKIHCYNGKILDIRETEDVAFTLGNILAGDWEVIE